MKKTPRIDKSKLPFGIGGHVVEPRRGDSQEHLVWIRKLPCVVWKTAGAEAHHLIRVPQSLRSGRGMALKELDIFAIPLCHTPHMVLHDGPLDEAGYLLEVAGIEDAPRYALGLAAQSPDPEIRSYAKELLKRKETDHASE